MCLPIAAGTEPWVPVLSTLNVLLNMDPMSLTSEYDPILLIYSGLFYEHWYCMVFLHCKEPWIILQWHQTSERSEVLSPETHHSPQQPQWDANSGLTEWQAELKPIRPLSGSQMLVV